MKGTDDRSNATKFFNHLSYVIIGVALAFSSLLIYWNFQDLDVYEVKRETLVVNQDEILAGGTVTLEFSFCKNFAVDGMVTRSFVSRDTEILSNATIDDLGKTCFDNVKVPVPVPSQAETGEYRVRYVGTYKINPIKTHVEEYYSKPFNIKGQ